MLAPLELDLQAVVSHQVWVLGPNFDPLEGQQVFLTAEFSLQPLILCFKSICIAKFNNTASTFFVSFLLKLQVCISQT